MRTGNSIQGSFPGKIKLCFDFYFPGTEKQGIRFQTYSNNPIFPSTLQGLKLPAYKSVISSNTFTIGTGWLSIGI